jgi:hypothetical protein
MIGWTDYYKNGKGRIDPKTGLPYVDKPSGEAPPPAAFAGNSGYRTVPLGYREAQNAASEARRRLFGAFNPSVFEDVYWRSRNEGPFDPGTPEFGYLIRHANTYWNQPQFEGMSIGDMRSYAQNNFQKGGSSTYRNPPTENQWAKWRGPQDRLMPGQGPAFGMNTAEQASQGKVAGMPGQQDWNQFYKNARPYNTQSYTPSPPSMLPASRPPMQEGGATTLAEQKAPPVASGTQWTGGTRYNVYGGQVGPMT